MSGNNQKLFVFLAANKIAEINFIDDELHWHYETSWCQDGFPLSPHLPLNARIPSLNTRRFLRNLLPEGQGLDELLQRFNLTKSNTFGLSLALGNDLPGALVLSANENFQVQESDFRPLTSEELISRLDMREEIGIIFWDGKPRLSVAGVQDKINLMLNKQKVLGFGEGYLCSTHILKFETKRHIHLALNEYISMMLANKCGLSVAQCQLMRLGEHTALLVERFDRKYISANDCVKRRHVIDGCQALNLSPEYKYEQNFGNGRDVAHIREGASFKKLFILAKQCENPAQTQLQLIDWAIFNCLIFNFDAHAKNISFFVGDRGLALTPFYDLVNIAMYPKFDQNMAMALGDEFDGKIVNAYQFADFAEQCQLPRRLVTQRLVLIANRLIKALENSDDSFVKDKAEQTYITRYKKQLFERAMHLLGEASNINKIDL